MPTTYLHHTSGLDRAGIQGGEGCEGGTSVTYRGKRAEEVAAAIHVMPKYIEGDAADSTTEIPVAYHQMITNYFRQFAPYGESKPGPNKAQWICEQVYNAFPF